MAQQIKVKDTDGQEHFHMVYDLEDDIYYSFENNGLYKKTVGDMIYETNNEISLDQLKEIIDFNDYSADDLDIDVTEYPYRDEIIEDLEVDEVIKEVFGNFKDKSYNREVDELIEAMEKAGYKVTLQDGLL